MEHSQVSVLQGHTGFIIDLLITANGKYIVSSGSDNTLRRWNFLNKTQETLLKINEKILFFEEESNSIKVFFDNNTNQNLPLDNLWSI